MRCWYGFVQIIFDIAETKASNRFPRPWPILARGGMSETEKATAERYRDTAEEIRLVAQRTRSPEIRIELFDLAERYDRMATHAARRDGEPD